MSTWCLSTVPVTPKRHIGNAGYSETKRTVDLLVGPRPGGGGLLLLCGHRRSGSYLLAMRAHSPALLRRVDVRSSGYMEDEMSSATDQGLVLRARRFSYSKTLKLLTAALTSHGSTLFAVIDHAANAVDIGLDLPPTIVAAACGGVFLQRPPEFVT